MKIVAISVATTAALISASASAQDRQTDRASFNGPRIEARIGWDRPKLSAAFSDGNDTVTFDGGKSGVTYAGEVGYDVDLQTIVVGAYAGLEGSTVKECSEIYGLDRACIRAGRNFNAGVRAGFKIGETAMIYGKAGYSNGRVSVDYRDDEGILENFNVGSNVSGLHVGGGIEVTFTNRVYSRLEYVHTNYDSKAVRTPDIIARADLKRDQALYSIGYRF